MDCGLPICRPSKGNHFKLLHGKASPESMRSQKQLSIEMTVLARFGQQHIAEKARVLALLVIIGDVCMTHLYTSFLPQWNLREHREDDLAVSHQLCPDSISAIGPAHQYGIVMPLTATQKKNTTH